MLRNSFLYLPLLIFPVLFFLFIDSSHSLELLSLDYFQEGEISKLELTFNDEGIKAKRFHVIEDKQIILDLDSVEAGPKILRAFDTSEFSGSVIFVSPYKKPGKDKDIRIALQLRDNVRSILEIEGRRAILSIENRFGVFTQKKLEENSMTHKNTFSAAGESRIRIPKSNSVEDILENLTLSGVKKYVGKKISFNVKDISYVDLLKMIADSSGFNIIISDEINKLPPTSLTLTNIPWDQALDTVLSIGKLVATKNSNILIINTLERANQEAQIEVANRELNEKKIPVVTKIFPISFAKIDDLKTLLGEYSTKDRGAISIDVRTNSLIIKDTADVIEKMKKIIETLDTQTPQIMIESKIVEVSESFAKEVGLSDGINIGYDPIAPIPDSAQGPGFAFSSAPESGDATRNFLSLGVASFRRIVNLNFRLQLMESESKAKIISNPKVITENKKTATISSTETTSFAVTSFQNGVPTTTFENISAAINLSVTPQVTNEGSIIMEINLDKGSFGNRPSPNAPPNTTTRNLRTNVLVDNGSTVVIGGIYSISKTDSVSGIPFLKDLPLIGWLFRTSYRPTQDKNELIIFVTPRIINQEEAGLVDRNEPAT